MSEWMGFARSRNVERQAPGLPEPVMLLLRAVVLVQCAGLVATAFTERTAIEAFLFLEIGMHDVMAWHIDRAVALGLLGLAAVGLAMPRRWMYWAMAGWFAAIALARAHLGGEAFSGLAPFASAARWGAPLVVALALGSAQGSMRLALVRPVLRGVVAVTFLAHGWEAWCAHPAFVDYILMADRRIFALGLDQPTAESLLAVIGVIDVALACAVAVGLGRRPLLVYMAGWGLLTAASRTVHSGMHGLDDSVLRFAHFGLPLALMLLPRQLPKLDWRRVVAAGAYPSRIQVPLLCAMAVASATFAGHPHGIAQDELTPRQWRVIWAEEPAHRATVSWTTSSSGAEHAVYYDTDSHGGVPDAYAHEATVDESGAYVGGGPYYHHAPLAGLEPSTTYYFVMVSDGVASEELHFTTAPVDDRPFKLLFGGDSRSGRSARQRMNERMASLLTEHPDIVALAHGGDFVARGADWSDWDEWLTDHERTTTDEGRVLPVIPARGNHEPDRELYNAVLGSPGGDEVDYFTTVLGRQLTWVTLDSNISHGGSQRDWLQRQLEAVETRWVVPSYHRPAYPAVKSPGSALEHWVPLFEEHNVDFACESDGHVLKRTVPIRDGEPAEDGIVYVGEGGLGVGQRTPVDQWYFDGEGMTQATHHVALLSFSDASADYTVFDDDGDVVDEYVFTPRRELTPEPRLASAEAEDLTTVHVRFTRPMDSVTGTEPSRYTLSDGAEVREVWATDAPERFTLTTTELSAGQRYTLGVSGVVDTDGIPLPEGAELTFTAPAPEEGGSEGGGSEGGGSEGGGAGSGSPGAGTSEDPDMAGASPADDDTLHGSCALVRPTRDATRAAPGAALMVAAALVVARRRRRR